MPSKPPYRAKHPDSRRPHDSVVDVQFLQRGDQELAVPAPPHSICILCYARAMQPAQQLPKRSHTYLSSPYAMYMLKVLQKKNAGRWSSRTKSPIWASAARRTAARSRCPPNPKSNRRTKGTCLQRRCGRCRCTARDKSYAYFSEEYSSYHLHIPSAVPRRVRAQNLRFRKGGCGKWTEEERMITSGRFSFR